MCEVFTPNVNASHWLLILHHFNSINIDVQYLMSNFQHTATVPGVERCCCCCGGLSEMHFCLLAFSLVHRLRNRHSDWEITHENISIQRTFYSGDYRLLSNLFLLFAPAITSINCRQPSNYCNKYYHLFPNVFYVYGKWGRKNNNNKDICLLCKLWAVDESVFNLIIQCFYIYRTIYADSKIILFCTLPSHFSHIFKEITMEFCYFYYHFKVFRTCRNELNPF